MALTWLRWLVASLLPGRTGFSPKSVHVGFVVYKVALGQVSLRVIRFPLSASFHHASPYSYIIWRVNNRPLDGRSSETSHPIDTNNNNGNTNSVSIKGGLFLRWFNCNHLHKKGSAEGSYLFCVSPSAVTQWSIVIHSSASHSPHVNNCPLSLVPHYNKVQVITSPVSGAPP
jgi:hypothetical protein